MSILAHAGDAPTKPATLDLTEISALLQKVVSEQIPRKEIEDASGWGQTTTALPRLALPRLQRTRVIVAGREELPQGLWKRSRISIADPQKDVVTRATDFKVIEGGNYRITVNSDVKMHIDTDLQFWQRGLLLLDTTAHSDAKIKAVVECDLVMKVDTSKFPPDVKIEPKISQLTLDLADYRLNQVGPVSREGIAQIVDIDFNDVIRSSIKSKEPELKEKANEAVIRAVREGKLPMAPFIKALANVKK